MIKRYFIFPLSLFLYLNGMIIAFAFTGPDTFSDLAESVSPSVVNISTTGVIEQTGPEVPSIEDFFNFPFNMPRSEPSEREFSSLGSGFVISEDGFIVTNNHVVENASDIQVTFTDGEKIEAELIAFDAETDLALLKVNANNLDYLEFGDIKLRVSRVLVEEPDSRGTYSFYGARILINIDDVVPAGVILAGSRVKHRLLVALSSDVDPIILSNYRDWLSGSLTIHQRVIDPQMAEERIADSIDKGRRFLLLSGGVGLVLSAIALALASHQFAVDEVMQVGLYKSWGLSRGRIRRFYLGYGLLIALVGAALGICVGAVVQEVLVFLISDWLPITLPRAGPRPLLVGLGTGLLCVIGFMLPAIWHLPNLPPMTVLRKDLPVQSVGRIYRGLIGALTIALLLVWYSNNLFIAISILCGLLIVATTAAGFGLIFFRLGKWLSQFLGGAWRLALANLWRRRDQNLIQPVSYTHLTLPTKA